MQQVKHSTYIAQKKPIAKALLKMLLSRFGYASILVTDCESKSFSISGNGTSIYESDTMGGKGMVVRVYDGRGYAEYSANEITEESISRITEEIEKRLIPISENMPDVFSRVQQPLLSDEKTVLKKSTEYEVHPKDIGDNAIITRLSGLRKKALETDSRLLDVTAVMQYQEYHKLFISANKDMEQSVLWTTGAVSMVASRGEEAKRYYRGYSNLGGAELFSRMEADTADTVRSTMDLLDSEPMVPGVYDCICTPDVTGMIVHEAFGHGVEMDMFVKDRARAKDFVGRYVASPLVTMHDGCGENDVATYFFDDEGTLSQDTVIIDRGVLVRGISDAQSAMRLGTAPTGNGRRESYERKAYTRMTNTYFSAGEDKLEDMIASVKYGMLLENPTSGMEDPKNWGIQCMVNMAREIKDGKLTGRVFSPIVLTGYVPDLLKSITMISNISDHCGSGACGKGHKEWVKVSDGGPYIKAKIRLG